MAQPQPIIQPPFQDDRPMPSPPYLSFNPASYTRAFFGSPISWRPGSFGNGNRYYPDSCSPDQLLGPLNPTDLRGAGKISSSIESDRGSIMNALSAMEREDELCRNYSCCGLNLQDLHALVDHFEECHVVVVDPCAQPGQGQLYPNNVPSPTPNPKFDSYLPNSPQVQRPQRQHQQPQPHLQHLHHHHHHHHHHQHPQQLQLQQQGQTQASYHPLSAQASTSASASSSPSSPSTPRASTALSPDLSQPSPPASLTRFEPFSPLSGPRSSLSWRTFVPPPSIPPLVPVAPKHDTCYSDTLHPTFSSWVRNMKRLSALIDRLSELAATAPQEHRSQLIRQVTALRKDSNKQRKRYSDFLQLTKEYGDRFLSDISEEIQQQSSFLDALEKRLDMAKSLRKEAIHMRKSYEDGTLDCIKKVRRTVLSEPLPEDVDLFREMDIVLNEIRQCYIDMDKFWVDEVQRVTKSLKDRRVDPEDIDRWKIFGESLEHSIARWETSPTNNEVTLRSDALLPVHNLGRILSSLSVVSSAMQRILQSVRLCASTEVESVKPIHYSFILQGEVKFSENRASCLEFLRGCVRYGKNVAMTCMAFASYSPFSRTRTSQDLVDRATRLGAERVEVSVQVVVQMQGMRRFNSIHKKCLAKLRKMDHELNALLGCISAWVTELGAYSTFPATNIKHIRGLCRIWVKNRDAIEHVLTALPLIPF